LGCEAYVRKLQPEKLEPKSEKCIFVGYPRDTLGYTFYHPAEGKTFVAKTGSFLEKEFLAKGVDGRKVELDKIVNPSLEIPSSVIEAVRNAPSIEEEQGAPDENHGVLAKQTEHRPTQLCKSPEWFGDPILFVMLIDHENLQTTWKQWKAPSPRNG
jgi:hypothetical protein